MMECIVLGSNSKGNGYILTNGKEMLIIEAGMPLKEVYKHKAPDNKIVGLIVTHEHSDHAKYIDEYLNAGIPCFALRDVVGKSKCKLPTASIYSDVGGIRYQCGKFTITPFWAYHDVSCVYFLIQHKEIGRLVFATDTRTIDTSFANVDIMMIETNYAEETIKEYNNNTYNHLELSEAIRIVNFQDKTRLKQVILLHLSSKNSNEKLFVRRMQEGTGIPTYVAKKNARFILG